MSQLTLFTQLTLLVRCKLFLQCISLRICSFIVFLYAFYLSAVCFIEGYLFPYNCRKYWGKSLLPFKFVQINFSGLISNGYAQELLDYIEISVALYIVPVLSWNFWSRDAQFHPIYVRFSYFLHLPFSYIYL